MYLINIIIKYITIFLLDFIFVCTLSYDILWYLIKYAITNDTDRDTPAKQCTRIFVFYNVSRINDIDWLKNLLISNF